MPDGMELHRIGILNLLTVIGDDWERVNTADFGTEMVMFTVDEQTDIVVSKSVTFGGSDNFLEIMYQENQSYDQFIRDFVEKAEEEADIHLEKIDKVNKHNPIFAFTTEQDVQAFSISETDRPIMIMLIIREDEPELELIKKHDRYDQFIEMIKLTETLPAS